MHASLADYSPTTRRMRASLAGYSPTTRRMRANLEGYSPATRRMRANLAGYSPVTPEHSCWLAGMDDEEWTYEESPGDASRFHVIVIDSDVQTRSPYNRITDIVSERSMKYRCIR
jgi:hypothetical protein